MGKKNVRKRVFSLTLSLLIIMAALPLSSFASFAQNTADYLVSLNINTLEAAGDINQTNKSEYYIDDFKGVSVYHYSYRDNKVYLGPSWGYLYNNNYGTLENPYAVFSVQGGTDFKLVCNVNSRDAFSVSSRLNLENEDDWRLHIYTSTDGSSWTDIGKPSVVRDDNLSLNYIQTYQVSLNKDVKFVKAEFPHTGNASGLAGGNAGNDYMGISEIDFTPFDSNAPIYSNSIIVDDMTDTGIIDSQKNSSLNFESFTGLAINQFESQKYLTADYDYLYQKQSVANPYLMLKVKGGTYFKTSVSHRTTDCNNMGVALGYDPDKKWTVLISTSVDGENWTEIDSKYTVTSDKLGETYHYEVKLSDDTIYVKLVFPQTGDMSLVSKYGGCGYDYLGISEISYTPFENTPKIVQYNYKDLQQIPINGANGTTGNLSSLKYLDILGAYDISLNTDTYQDANYSALQRSGDGSIRAGWAYLYTHNQGDAAAYITYNVHGGTSFEATMNINNNSYYGKPGWESLECYKGKKFEFKLQTSADGAVWTDAVASGEKYGDITLAIDKLADDTRYVRVMFPQDGNANGKNTSGRIFNDMAELRGVKYTRGNESVCDPDEKYGSVYNYNQLKATDNAGLSDADTYGVYESLGMNISKYSKYNGEKYLGASREYLLNAKNVANPYVVYHTKGGTDFKLVVSHVQARCAEIAASLGMTDKGWTVKIYTSADGKTWNTALVTPDYSWNKGLGRNDTYHLVLPKSVNLVKVEFPQTGNMSGEPGSDNVGDDYIGIEKVSLTRSVGDIHTYEKDIIFNEMGEKEFDSESDKSDLQIYDCQGIVSTTYKYRDQKKYLGASWSYLFNSMKTKNPYVIYNVKPGTDFKVVASHAQAACSDVEKRLGVAEKSWTISIFVSSDTKNWKQLKSNPLYEYGAGLGRNDIYEIRLGQDVEYVKIVFPQDGNASGEPGVGNAGNDYIGLSEIALTPGTNTIFNPEGSYIFDTIIDYHTLNLGNITTDQMSACGMSSYSLAGLYCGRLRNGKNYLSVNYEYIYKYSSVPQPYAIYNVVPGTAFQIATKYVSKIRTAMTNATGKDFSIKIFVSANQVDWSEADVLLTYKSDNDKDFDITEISTIERLAENIRFVKVVFPQSGNMSLISNGATPYAGNDFLGIQRVSFAKGNDVKPVMNADEYSFGNKIDCSRDKSIDLTVFDSNAVCFDEKMEKLTSCWAYYNNCHGERANPYIILPVQHGTAFYAEAATRNNIFFAMGEQEFRFKLYASADERNWTNVTDKYVYRTMGTGSFSFIDKFCIDSIDSNINYIKIEFPNSRDYTDYVTQRGEKLKYVGNDYCGITKIYYTESSSLKKPYYEHDLNYNAIYSAHKDLNSDVSEQNAAILGLYEYSMSSLCVSDASSTYLKTNLLWLKKDYLFNKKDLENPYVVYNVKPGTAFECSMYVNETESFKCGKNITFKLYVSETGGKDANAWTEINEGFYSYSTKSKLTSNIRFRAKDIGKKTNFVKIVFPQNGDMNLLTGGKTEYTGNDFFGIEYVKCCLKNYSAEYTAKKDPVYVFLNPSLDALEGDGKSINNADAKAGLGLVSWLLIIGGGIVGLGVLTTVTVVMLKKKKNHVKKAN